MNTKVFEIDSAATTDDGALRDMLRISGANGALLVYWDDEDMQIVFRFKTAAAGRFARGLARHLLRYGRTDEEKAA